MAIATKPIPPRMIQKSFGEPRMGVAIASIPKMDAIMEMGCMIKDLEIGLVDFPHILESQEEEVYLCWKYGEKKVRFWHGLNEGFASRKPLARKVHPH